MENKIRVRYRIDGVMQNSGVYQINMLPAIITRIKIIGGMDISEKRKPQDGRITSIVDRVFLFSSYCMNARGSCFIDCPGCGRVCRDITAPKRRCITGHHHSAQLK